MAAGVERVLELAHIAANKNTVPGGQVGSGARWAQDGRSCSDLPRLH